MAGVGVAQSRVWTAEWSA